GQDNLSPLPAPFNQPQAGVGSVRAANHRIGTATRYDPNQQVLNCTPLSPQQRARITNLHHINDEQGAQNANENKNVISVAPIK
ncbi:hypothetical protein AAGG49_22005, partial [Stenotrophomonas maltophilia]